MAQDLTALGHYSVITRGNFSTNSDVEGRTLAGGNFTGTSSANFAIKLQTPASEPTLQIAGNLVSGNPLNMASGSMQLGGIRGGNRIVNPNNPVITGIPAGFSEIFNNLTLGSASLAAMEAKSTTSVSLNQPGPFKFIQAPGADGTAVFSVSGATLFDNNKVQQIELESGSATAVVINVSGTSINWTNGNMVGIFNSNAWRERVIWNFYEATSVNLGSRGFSGQILAPFAALTSQGPIDGSVFADSISTTGEVHLPVYKGSLKLVPSTHAPEPGTALLTILGVFLPLMRRRR